MASACEARWANYFDLKVGYRSSAVMVPFMENTDFMRVSEVQIIYKRGNSDMWKLFQNDKCGIIIFMHRRAESDV